MAISAVRYGATAEHFGRAKVVHVTFRLLLGARKSAFTARAFPSRHLLLPVCALSQNGLRTSVERSARIDANGLRRLSLPVCADCYHWSAQIVTVNWAFPPNGLRRSFGTHGQKKAPGTPLGHAEGKALCYDWPTIRLNEQFSQPSFRLVVGRIGSIYQVLRSRELKIAELHGT